MKRKFICNKKGSHVGVILSFVIFVTFLIFLYSAVEPIIKTQKEKDSLLDFIRTEIIDNATKDVTTSVVELKGVNKDCYYFKPDISADNTKKIITKNEDGVSVLSGWYTSSEVFFHIDKEKFLKIFFLEESPEVKSSPTGCKELEENKYEITFTRTKLYIYESVIKSIIEEYNIGNIEPLKQQFSIPTGSDFGIVFRNYEGSILSTNEGNLTTSVYSKEFNIEYIDENATERTGALIVRVW